MLLYPIAYMVLIIPIATSRFAAWAGNKVPVEVTIFTDAIFLLSGLVNVVLFTTTRRILPTESMRIGQWSIFRPGDPPAADDNGVNSLFDTSQTKTHTRNISEASSEGSTVVGSDDGHILTKQPRKARPADIIIRRDSVESMYSVYDEEDVHVEQRSALQAPPVSSHWSPDSPHNRWAAKPPRSNNFS